MKTILFVLSSLAAAATFTDRPNTVLTDSRQITFTGPRSGEGYFSQDGRRMIFQSEREPGNPFYQMYLLELDSGKTTRLSPGSGKTTCGWIHPSGKKVMWSSTHLDPKSSDKAKEEYETRAKPVKSRYAWSYDENFDIFESDLNGRHVKRLTKEKGYDAEGSYSPDGQWIAFASNRSGYTEKMSEEDAKIFAQDPSFAMEIYIMKSDGTQVKRLTHSKGYDGGPFFSADGKKITWRRFSPDGSKAEIYTMNVDGTDQKQITRLGSMSWAPYFHPSGDYLIFTSSVLGYANFELFIVDAEGKKDPVRVSFEDGFDGLPVFTPDGNSLSWTHRNEKGESQIYLAKWDDAQARRLLGLPPRSPGPEGLSPEVTEPDVKRLVEWLASETMGGRRAGSDEEKVLIAKYSELFRRWGLVGGAPDGSFFQHFTFTSNVKLGEGNKLEFVGAVAKNAAIGTEAEPYSFAANGEFREAPIVFAGYGLKAPATDRQAAYDSYRDLDVKGKWVLILKDLPENLPPERRQHLNLYARLQHKVTVAREAGAAGVLVMDGFEPLKPIPGKSVRFDGSLSETSLPVWRVGGSFLKDLFKKADQDFAAIQKKLSGGELVSFLIPSVYLRGKVDLVHETSTATNVVARLKGTNPKAGAILIGAHSDHLGRGEMGSSLAKGSEQGQVHYGADDNASGVAAVLEIAHHMASESAKNPRRLAKDVYFGLWSAEEIGVLGSKAFVRDWEKRHGDFKKTFVASLNLDMVGRLRDRLQIQGVASGDNWSRLGEEMALRTGLPIVMTEDPYVPSDGLSFYMAGVPSINFFTGSHNEYHTPRDTPETLNDSGLVRVAKLAEGFADLLADSSLRMVTYRAVKGSDKSRLEGRTFRLYLGTVPDYSQEGAKGVRLSGVSKDSPAEKAGLREKDVIIEFAGTKIENLYDYVYALQTAAPNVETSLRIRRGDKDVDLKITPRLKE